MVIKYKNSSITNQYKYCYYIILNGAGSENRTRATRSEAWDSTTKLYPHQHIHYTTNITNMQIKIKI